METCTRGGENWHASNLLSVISAIMVALGIVGVILVRDHEFELIIEITWRSFAVLGLVGIGMAAGGLFSVWLAATIIHEVFE